MSEGALMKSGAMLLLLVWAAGSAGAVTEAGQATQDTVPHAGMLRYPDVSATHIVFAYANDLWIVPREGGQAQQLASPPGGEMFPKFSPDGRRVAFMGNYDGGRDLYVVSAGGGGVAERVTHHPSAEFLTDWTADGRLVYFASGLGGLGRQTQIFTVSPEGGLPTKLAVPYGANGSISTDGKWLAYTPHTRDFRTWKRYRGGMATDIWLFNLETYESRRITEWEGTDTLPMWHKDVVYYLSDDGPEHRLNIWRFDTRTNRREQITRFADYDVKFPSIGPGDKGQGEIVFQQGSRLMLLDLGTRSAREVRVTIPGDRPRLRPRMVDASQHLGGGGISPTGKRVVVEARGDIWTVPAEKGPARQMTDTSGAAERSPAWSPDGRWIAYFSDEQGEYELYVTQSDGRGETRRVTDGNTTYFYQIRWAPDSKKLIITDKAANIILVDLADGSQRVLDRDPWASQPRINWSGDSRWIAYDKVDADSRSSAIWLYDLEEDQAHQVTSGFFNDANPVFSRKGDYLYYVSNRDFSNPRYEDLGTTFVYSNTGRLIATPLHAEVENPRKIVSDEETWKEEKPKDASEETNEADEAKEGEEAPAADAAAPESPLHGVWTGTIKGLSKIPGMTQDEIDFRLSVVVGADGSISASGTSMGQTRSYDSVTFDASTGEVVLTRSEMGMTSRMKGVVRDGRMSGTWEVVELGISGTFECTRTDEKPEGTDAVGASTKADEKVKIDLDGFEARGMEVPVSSGRFANLASNSDGHLLFVRFAQEGPPAIKIINIRDEKPEEKTVLAAAGGFDVSADGKKLLTSAAGKWVIVNASAGQSADKPLSVSALDKSVDPREEWRQIFTDAWRRHRDFFYVENLHGVDWEGVRRQYEAMLADASSREDVSFIIGEMISELNVGHAYYWGGETESEPSRNVGMLGVDFELGEVKDEDGRVHRAYTIAKLYHGAPWDSDARNPLTAVGADVKPGTYLIAVNGRRVDVTRDPWAAFVGTAGRDTTLTLADALVGDTEARNERDVTLRPLASEGTLRYRAWIEQNRRYVEERSGGKIGYIFVPNTGVDGQNDLFRQFYGQTGKQALIIDERWNGGGQIPTRFIELLNRPRTNYWARRDGKDWPWPPDSHQGPKVMLINGLAGSGGDMFPWLFRHNGIGKLIGTRTWGGLVGITGVPGLIDGGYTAVPTFGFYETDGTWGVEGHGVDPDIEVIDDPTQLARGIDPQLEAAIRLMLEEIEQRGYRPPARPADPDRSGMGIDPRDK
ncbi:MAG: PD40 domain-containing protein [Phycisphaeraceae bacterium]|nr:PD40 domain-containing protein [Phycisphaeraceae bacterium]